MKLHIRTIKVIGEDQTLIIIRRYTLLWKGSFSEIIYDSLILFSSYYYYSSIKNSISGLSYSYGFED